MPHSALAVARKGSEPWSGDEIEVDELEDLDALLELLRDRFDGAVVLLLVEEDDEWMGVVRFDGGDDDDPRVFLSDGRVVQTSPLARRLFEDALPVEPPVETDEDEESASPDIEPVGDLELLSDLGTAGDRLVDLCAEEGALPSDVIAAVAEACGAGEVLERLRPA